MENRGWLKQGLEEARNEVKNWPRWMRSREAKEDESRDKAKSGVHEENVIEALEYDEGG